jgi:hypothetical protein
MFGKKAFQFYAIPNADKAENMGVRLSPRIIET